MSAESRLEKWINTRAKELGIDARTEAELRREVRLFEQQNTHLTQNLAEQAAKVEGMRELLEGFEFSKMGDVLAWPDIESIRDALEKSPSDALKEHDKELVGPLVEALEQISKFHVDPDGMCGGHAVEIAQAALNAVGLPENNPPIHSLTP